MQISYEHCHSVRIKPILYITGNLIFLMITLQRMSVNLCVSECSSIGACHKGIHYENIKNCVTIGLVRVDLN